MEFECGKWTNRELVAHAVEQELNSDAELVLFGQFDAKLGWTEQFPALIKDTSGDSNNSTESIVNLRVCGILAGFDDQDDHDTGRSNRYV